MNSIRDRRHAAGLTQHELADLSGVRPRVIQLYEAGETTPSVLIGIRMARALGCAVEDLFVTHEADGTSAAPARGNRTPRRRSNAPGHGSTEEPREQSAV